MKAIRNIALAAAVLLTALVTADAQDFDKIKKTLSERVPQMGTVDEVNKTPMPGLYEVRVGTDIFYTDADGNFLIQGLLMDTKQRRNLTEERQEKLLLIPFDQLPFKDAFTIVRGNGKRKIAIFEDPNCPYCKRFEQDLLMVNNVTVSMFLYPILGPDSNDKSRNLWCAKDRATAWLDWMVRAKPPADANCDIAPVTRNVEFGRKYRITGTPTMILADGRRIPGAMPPQDVEKLLNEIK